MNMKEELLKIFSLKLRTILGKLTLDFDLMQEIRLRMNAPLLIIYENKEAFLSEEARLVEDPSKAVIITKNEIRETMEYISNYSLYAFEEEIRQGFITISGGHRIGIAGKIIIEDGVIKGNEAHLVYQYTPCASDQGLRRSRSPIPD